MAGNDCINEAKIRLLECHLEEIVTACNVMKDAGYKLAGSDADTVDSFAVIALAVQAGCRADACRKLIGELEIIGGWEEWISTDVERAARENLAAQEVSHG